MKREIVIRKDSFEFIFDVEYFSATGPTYGCGGTPEEASAELKRIEFNGAEIKNMDAIAESFIEDMEQLAWELFFEERR